MGSFWRRLTVATVAFREAYFASDEAHEDDFESVEGRQMRYALYWSFFENIAYRGIHSWSTGMKHQLGIYKDTRNLYNPAYRLGTFWASHVWGGALDRDAELDGAIPIETENEKLRPAIAQLWKDSNFSALKDIIPLRGSIEGDVVLRVQDDPVKKRVFIERVNPSIVTSVEKDVYGNVKGYVIEEKRQDPVAPSREVDYREEVTRSGEFVVYRTFKNGKLFAWGEAAEWAVPYTFVPMVAFPHRDVGLEWGWSELHAARSKICELDDLASMISDQIRKYVNTTYSANAKAPAGAQTARGALRDLTGGAYTRPEPAREELKIYYTGSADIKYTPMVSDLNLSHGLEHIKGLLEELEREYPELQTDIWASGATSGRALRIARQRVDAKVYQLRAGYDAALVKIEQQGIAIGGWRGYAGYEGFGLDSYAAGALDHYVADRSVFAVDPMDDVEISAAFWAAAKVAKEAGVPLEGFLKREGWSDEEIQEVVGDDEGTDTEVSTPGRGTDGGREDAAAAGPPGEDGGTAE